MTHHQLSLALVASFALLVLAGTPAAAQVFTDDFNDGDDAGWTRADSISDATGGAFSSTYSFPGGDSYRIQGVGSPNPGALGPARAGSARLDITQTAFSNSVDIVDWDNTLNQAFGLAARASNPGPGTTDGYLAVYSNNFDEFSIRRVDNEVVSEPTSDAVSNSHFANLTLDPANDYRFVFSGVGPALSAQLFDLNDLVNPLATITAVDATYASGSPGVFTVFSQQPATDLTTGTDATFDNFSTAVPEPTSLALLGLGGLTLLRRRDTRAAPNPAVKDIRRSAS